MPSIHCTLSALIESMNSRISFVRCSWLERVMMHTGHCDISGSDVSEELKRESGRGSVAAQCE